MQHKKCNKIKYEFKNENKIIKANKKGRQKKKMNERIKT